MVERFFVDGPLGWFRRFGQGETILFLLPSPPLRARDMSGPVRSMFFGQEHHRWKVCFCSDVSACQTSSLGFPSRRFVFRREEGQGNINFPKEDYRFESQEDFCGSYSTSWFSLSMGKKKRRKQPVSRPISKHAGPERPGEHEPGRDEASCYSPFWVKMDRESVSVILSFNMSP